MKLYFILAALSFCPSPTFALTELDQVKIACMIGKKDAGQPELTPEAWLRACTRWIEIDPAGRDLALARRGDFYKRNGELKLALSDYTASIDLDVGSGLTLRKRALVLAELGRTREALSDLSRHIEILETQENAFMDPAVAYLYRAALLFDAIEGGRLQEERVPEGLARIRDDLEVYLAHPRARSKPKRASAQDLLSRINARLENAQP